MYRSELEYKLGSACLIFSTQQRALEASLESLGVDKHGTPCVVSAIAPPWVVAAILRAGGQPVIIDIEQNSFHFDREVLKELLSEDTCVYIDYRVLGVAPEQYLEILKDAITIGISPLPFVEKEYIDKYTFSIYSMETIYTQEGGLLFTKFPDVKKTLLEIRDGILGMRDVFQIYPKYTFSDGVKMDELLLDNRHKSQGFSKFCKELPVILGTVKSHKVLLRVMDAEKAVVNLEAAGIKSSVALRPLHTYPEIGIRYKEKPSYPNAEKLYNKVISLDYSSKLEIIKKEIT